MLRHLQFPRDEVALGLSAAFLSNRQPFSGQSAQEFIGTLMGQIKRKHYLLTLNEGTVVGFLGWGLCEPEIANKWAHGEYRPSFKECLGGETVLLFSVAATDPAIVRAQRRALKERYPGQPLVGRRVKDGKARPLLVKV